MRVDLKILLTYTFTTHTHTQTLRAGLIHYLVPPVDLHLTHPTRQELPIMIPASHHLVLHLCPLKRSVDLGPRSPSLNHKPCFIYILPASEKLTQLKHLNTRVKPWPLIYKPRGMKCQNTNSSGGCVYSLWSSRLSTLLNDLHKIISGSMLSGSWGAHILFKSLLRVWYCTAHMGRLREWTDPTWLCRDAKSASEFTVVGSTRLTPPPPHTLPRT